MYAPETGSNTTGVTFQAAASTASTIMAVAVWPTHTSGSSAVWPRYMREAATYAIGINISRGAWRSHEAIPRQIRSPAAPTIVAAAVPKKYTADSQGIVCRYRYAPIRDDSAVTAMAPTKLQPSA